MKSYSKRGGIVHEHRKTRSRATGKTHKDQRQFRHKARLRGEGAQIYKKRLTRRGSQETPA